MERSTCAVTSSMGGWFLSALAFRGTPLSILETRKSSYFYYLNRRFLWLNSIPKQNNISVKSLKSRRSALTCSKEVLDAEKSRQCAASLPVPRKLVGDLRPPLSRPVFQPVPECAALPECFTHTENLTPKISKAGAIDLAEKLEAGQLEAGAVSIPGELNDEEMLPDGISHGVAPQGCDISVKHLSPKL